MKKFASVVLYGCGISLFASSCVQKAEEKKLNVLFIMTDQQRYDMLSCAGNRYVSTPSLDRLAENGVRFEHNYCAIRYRCRHVLQWQQDVMPAK